MNRFASIATLAAGLAMAVVAAVAPTSASASTFTTAPALTTAQLAQLGQVTAWNITVHKEYLMQGSIGGGPTVTGIYTCGVINYACAVAGWNASVLETDSLDATLTVSGAPGCRGTFYQAGCPVTYGTPGQVSETFSYASRFDGTATSGCPTAIAGINTNPGEITATSTVDRSGTMTLDGSPGHQASTGSEFFIDYSTNAPTSGFDAGTVPYGSGEVRVTTVTCGDTAVSRVVPTSLPPSDLAFYFANPPYQDGGGDTQVRVEGGQFIVSGSDDYSDSGSVPVEADLGNSSLLPIRIPITYQEHDTWTARSASGLDTTPPIVTVPVSPLSVEATGPAGAAVSFVASATDPDDSSVAVICNPASGATFPLGLTTVTCTSTDPAGNAGTGVFTVQVRDATPPVLTLPADNTIDATSPAGAQFLFNATALDFVDGSVPVNCFPISATVFAIGVTLVQCTASDHAGNVAQGSFHVTVRGAADQLADLRDSVTSNGTGPGTGTSFADQLQAALVDLGSGDTATACTDLQAFINHVQAQSGKGLTAQRAAALVAAATRIKAIIGC